MCYTKEAWMMSAVDTADSLITVCTIRRSAHPLGRFFGGHGTTQERDILHAFARQAEGT